MSHPLSVSPPISTTVGEGEERGSGQGRGMEEGVGGGGGGTTVQEMKQTTYKEAR